MRSARRVAMALSDRIPAASSALLFCSDLLRTRQTAEPIAESLGLQMLADADLREQSYRADEGTPPGSTPYVHPPMHGDRMHHRDGIDGSESRFEWAGRAYAALQRILACAAQDVIVVTQGGTAAYLVAAWIGLPLEEAGYVKFKVSPGSITHLREDEFFPRQASDNSKRRQPSRLKGIRFQAFRRRVLAPQSLCPLNVPGTGTRHYP